MPALLKSIFCTLRFSETNASIKSIILVQSAFFLIKKHISQSWWLAGNSYFRHFPSIRISCCFLLALFMNHGHQFFVSKVLWRKGQKVNLTASKVVLFYRKMYTQSRDVIGAIHAPYQKSFGMVYGLLQLEAHLDDNSGCLEVLRDDNSGYLDVLRDDNSGYLEGLLDDNSGYLEGFLDDSPGYLEGFLDGIPGYLEGFLDDNPGYLEGFLDDSPGYLEGFLDDNSGYLEGFLDDNSGYLESLLDDNTGYLEGL